MIVGMPIEGVKDRVELHQVQQAIYWFNYFWTIMLSGAIFYVEGTTYKVVLYVYNEKYAFWSCTNFYPAIPADLKIEHKKLKFKAFSLVAKNILKRAEKISAMSNCSQKITV